MSNSPLVDYTRLSPHYTRMSNKKNKKITIHHMAGNLSVESCGAVFQTRQGSSNYGIGSDGRVGLYVDESNRSWCSSNADNDKQAVTIEVANDVVGGNWHVSDVALAKLIELCVDICKRNDIKYLNYTGNASGNLTMHCWFASTQCPGPYLKSKFPYIAEEVNKRLGVTEIPKDEGTAFAGLQDGERVKLISGAKYKDGRSCPSWLMSKTLYVRDINGDYITISIYKTGSITGVVHKKYLVSLDNNTTVSAPTTTTKPVEKPAEKVESNTGYTRAQFVKDIQKAFGATVDGIAGPNTLSKTKTLSAHINASHSAVKYVQKYLYELGYVEIGKADGVAGPKFTSAVAHFQQDNGCAADGEITARNKTWKKLLDM